MNYRPIDADYVRANPPPDPAKAGTSILAVGCWSWREASRCLARHCWPDLEHYVSALAYFR